MALEKRLERHLEGEVSALRARVGQAAEQHIDAPLAARDLGSGRRLEPVELDHLTRAVAGPRRRSLPSRAQLAQLALDDVDRARVAVLITQYLGHARRLDVGPALERLADHRLETVDARALARASVARRLVGLDHPPDRPAGDPQSSRDLALRDAVRGERPDSAHSNALRTSRAPPCLTGASRPSVRAQAVVTGAASGALFAARTRCSIGRPASSWERQRSKPSSMTLRGAR